MGSSLTGTGCECGVEQVEFELLEEQLYGNFRKELELNWVCVGGTGTGRLSHVDLLFICEGVSVMVWD